MAISAGTVLLVGVGGVLVYAGFTSQNPLAALKEVTSGSPSPIREGSTVDPASFASTSGVSGGIAQVDYADVTPGAGLESLPRACEAFAGDKYDQIKRWQRGYSDCSSFVGKGLKRIGIKPPPGSTTGAYLASREWKRIRAEDVKPGDLACAVNHVLVCYGNGYGIGQQNRRVNVQKGRVSDLMYGNKPFVYLRYVGAGAEPKTAEA